MGQWWGGGCDLMGRGGLTWVEEWCAGPDVPSVDDQVKEGEQSKGRGSRGEDKGQGPEVLVDRDRVT